MRAADDPDYSDNVDIDDEIQATLYANQAYTKEALNNTENLAAERQQTLDLALTKEKSLLKE